MGEIFLGAGRLPNPPQAFVQWNDPQGNRLVSINRDGSVSAAGIMIGSVSPEANIVGVQFADGTIQTTAATGGIAIGLANDGNTETLTSAGITITDVNDNSITMSNAGILLADLSGNHLVLNTGIQLADTAGDSIFLFNGLTIDDQVGNSIVTSATGVLISYVNSNSIH